MVSERASKIYREAKLDILRKLSGKIQSTYNFIVASHSKFSIFASFTLAMLSLSRDIVLYYIFTYVTCAISII